jgi:hypothetical protein
MLGSEQLAINLMTDCLCAYQYIYLIVNLHLSIFHCILVKKQFL